MKYWLLLLSIFLTGCSFAQNGKSYAKDMMVSDRCSNACWLGIEPGMILGRNKVFDILSNHYGIDNVYYSEDGLGVSWYIPSSPVFSESGSIYIIGTDQVASIQIILQANQISINDLVAAFGKPEVTTVTNPKEEIQIGVKCGLRRLLYPKIGLGVIIDGAMEEGYVGMLYISKPFSINKEAFSGRSAEKETTIQWDERDKYCRNTTSSNP